ncbi:DNA polymerase V subunit UmuC [compost metagenome]
MPLLTPNSDTRDLVAAALAGLDRIFRPGFRYMKAGVVLMDLIAPGLAQVDMFAPASRPGGEQLMAVMDRINAEFGRGTLRPGRVPESPGWGMKREFKSPAYLSQWDELPLVR